MKKCRLSTGMDGRLSAVICAEKRGLNLARFLPSLGAKRTSSSWLEDFYTRKADTFDLFKKKDYALRAACCRAANTTFSQTQSGTILNL